MARLAFLKRILLEAFELNLHDINHDQPDLRRYVQTGNRPGIAAEHLRQFRNRLIHGDLQFALPDEWDADRHARLNEQPELRRSHCNIRLTLMLIQLLALQHEGSSPICSA